MKAIKQRPFATSCIIFLLFSFLFFLCGSVITIICALLCLTAFILSLVSRGKNPLLTVYILPPIILAAILSFVFFGINYKNITTYDGKECNVEFVITEPDYIDDSHSSYVVQIKKVNGRATNFKANLSVSEIYDAELFSSHSAKVKFSLCNGWQDSFTARYSFMSQGIYLYAHASDDITDNGKTVKLFPSYYFEKINSYFSGILQKHVHEKEYKLCSALFLGNARLFPEEDKYNFRLLGLSHMLAVSGLHLSILAGGIDFVLDKTKISKRKKHVAMVIMIFTYAGITGFSSSVKRAALMLILMHLSFLIAKRYDSVTSLCGAAALICLISPNAIFDIGLWLSFFSTYGIVTVAAPLDRRFQAAVEASTSFAKKSFLKLIAALLFGIVPVIFSLPVVWISYGEFAILSPISNILFTPLLLIILQICPFVLILSFFQPVAALAGYIVTLAASAMLSLAELLAPYSPIVSLRYPFTPYLLALLVLSFLVIALTNTKARAVYFIPIIIIAIIFSACVSIYNKTTFDDQKLIFSNSAFGDSFVIISHNRGLILDLSGMSVKNANLSSYILRENNVAELEGYVITDYRGNGTATLDILSSTIRLKKIYIPKSITADEKLIEQKFIDYSKENDIECILYDSNGSNQIDFYGVSVDVKRLSYEAINSPSDYLVTFSGETDSFSYATIGCNTTPYGTAELRILSEMGSSILFGAYGNNKVSSPFIPRANNKSDFYFASDDVYDIFETHMDIFNTKIIDDHLLEIQLN